MTASTLAPAEVAARYGLPRLGGRPALRAYLQSLWVRRHFGVELARSRFRAATSQDRLGIWWVVIKPLINAAVYGTVFGLLLPRSSRPEQFVPFLVAGIFVFQFFASSLSDGSKAITGNMGLVRTLHFPRALLPMATVQQQLYALVPSVAVIAAVVLASGEPVTWRWLQAAPALLLATMFNLGVAFLAARLTIHIRDITQLLPFVTRIAFYTSGVFFAIDRTVDQPVIRTLLQINPVHVYMSLVRGSFIESLPAAPAYWLWAVGWAVVILVGGFVFFWRAEERYGRA